MKGVLQPSYILASTALLASCGYRLDMIPNTYVGSINGRVGLLEVSCPKDPNAISSATNMVAAAGHYQIGVGTKGGHGVLYDFTIAGKARCVSLPFAPNHLLVTPDSRLVALSAWGQIPTIDLSKNQAEYLVSPTLAGQGTLSSAAPIWGTSNGQISVVLQDHSGSLEAFDKATAGWSEVAPEIPCQTKASPYSPRLFTIFSDGQYVTAVNCRQHITLLRATDAITWKEALDITAESGGLNCLCTAVKLKSVASDTVLVKIRDLQSAGAYLAVVDMAQGSVTLHPLPIEFDPVAKWGSRIIATSHQNQVVQLSEIDAAGQHWVKIGAALPDACDLIHSASGTENEIAIGCWKVRPSGSWSRTLDIFTSLNGGQTWSRL